MFTGIYLLIETLLLLGLLLAAAAGTRLGPALRLELDSLWLVALVLAIPFWLIPVPALLAEWSQVMERSPRPPRQRSSPSIPRSSPMALRLIHCECGLSPGTEKEIVNTSSCAAAISAAISHVSPTGATCMSAGPSGCTCLPYGC